MSTPFKSDLQYRNNQYIQQQNKKRRQLQGYKDYKPDTSEPVDNSEPATPDSTVTEQDPTV